MPISKILCFTPIFILPFLTNKLNLLNRLTAYLNERLPILFDKWVSKKVKDEDIVLVWAWAGLSTIKAAKKRGKVAILEECGSCNRHQNEILAEEYDRLQLRFEKPNSKFIIDRELKEAEMADYILCPSEYVAKSFIKYGLNRDKIKVIPYGVNLEIFKPTPCIKSDFTIIFVGSIGVRKGLIYLFKALEILKFKYPINCLIIGTVDSEFKEIFNLYKHLIYHIKSVNHKELIHYYNSASVFILPSLDEGMAYVQLEAMACGLPVICTPNSGCESIITNGIEGFIIPIKDSNELVKNVEKLYLDKDLLNMMGKNAYLKAQSFSWNAYGKKLVDFLNRV
ncbi:glycosyltransferase family 4 protein [Pedobacter lithocola]|uniref:glycosyltransferase family 4 protein n=1 Tax=Pedobacter lithocola TaxID=1908239 RepID=UPI00367321EB